MLVGWYVLKFYTGVCCVFVMCVCEYVCVYGFLAVYTNCAHCYQSSYSGTPVDDKKSHGLPISIDM